MKSYATAKHRLSAPLGPKCVCGGGTYPAAANYPDERGSGLNALYHTQVDVASTAALLAEPGASDTRDIFVLSHGPVIYKPWEFEAVGGSLFIVR